MIYFKFKKKGKRKRREEDAGWQKLKNLFGFNAE